MLGDNILYTALNVTDITDLLDSFGSGKALFSAKLLPTSFTGNKSINYYMSGVFNGALEYGRYLYSINCRSNDFHESKEIAVAVKDEINRNNYTNSFITVSILETIPPMDDTDVYNTPVEAIIKGGN